MSEQLSRIEDYINQQITACNDVNMEVTSAQELKELVNLWSNTIDKIKKLSRISRSLNILKKDYEEKIILFMKDNEIEELNTQTSIIQCIPSKPRKAHVKSDSLNNVIQDAELRTKIIDALQYTNNIETNGMKLKRLSLT
jgi:hypothetical protein